MNQWTETGNTSGMSRFYRGGSFTEIEFFLRSTNRTGDSPTSEWGNLGFRIAMVPEPSSFALAAIGMLVALGWIARRRASR